MPYVTIVLSHSTGLIGTYIHRVLVIDGYLYSGVYGIMHVHN